MKQIHYINKPHNLTKSEKKVWIALSPDYANIGDIAISIAQQKILQDIYPDRAIVEIPMLDFFECQEQVKNLMNDEDVITIIGGGNMGNIYLEGEERRRALIAAFPNNIIISFPQSIDFEKSEVGRQEFDNSIKIYGDHPNLTIFSREEKSHNIMSENFKNEVKLVPDTVLYLAGKIPVEDFSKRDKILICFRNDKEKVTSKGLTSNFIELLTKHNFKDIELIDTYLGNVEFQPSEKNELFENTLSRFKSAKLVITDRLHGMIFALITKTPCIAFDNSNKKISSTYHTWLKDVPYIKLLEDFEEASILNDIKEFSELDASDFNIDLTNHFEPLFQELKKYRD